MAIHVNSRVVRAIEPVTANVDDELVMADVDTGKYYGLNSVAAAIWRRLEREISVEDLCCQFQELYDVTPECCVTEVLAFLGQMEAKGLIRTLEKDG